MNRFQACLVASIQGLLLASVATATAGQGKDEPKKEPAAPAAKASPADEAVVRAQLPSYPLKTCVISGDELGKDGAPVDFVVDGRLVRLCCNDCKKDVEKDKAAAFKKVDAGVVAAQKPTYPLDTDPVTGAKLGDKAVDHVYGTRLVRLANADSVALFDKDPKTAMAKVDKAWIEAQRPTYALKTCVVSGEPLGGEMGEPVDYLYGTQLVRFCCKRCPAKFEKDPAPYLAKLAPEAKSKSK